MEEQKVADQNVSRKSRTGPNSGGRREQIVNAALQVTLYVLRIPLAAHLAAEKEREMKQLYAECLGRSSDVAAGDASRIAELSNFIYACFVGILTQWLATRDAPLLLKTTKQLVRAARDI